MHFASFCCIFATQIAVGASLYACAGAEPQPSGERPPTPVRPNQFHLKSGRPPRHPTVEHYFGRSDDVNPFCQVCASVCRFMCVCVCCTSISLCMCILSCSFVNEAIKMFMFSSTYHVMHTMRIYHGYARVVWDCWNRDAFISNNNNSTQRSSKTPKRQYSLCSQARQ